MIRSHYLNKIQKDLPLNFIKVLIGLRRIGKTTLLHQIGELFAPDLIVDLNFELLEYEHLCEYQALHIFLQSMVQQGKTVFLLDEIQRVSSREKVINSLHSQYPELQIFITGSNSKLLSSELTTYLRGRYIEYTVHPFSYHEYCQYFELQVGSESFSNYLKDGGIPLLYRFPEHERQAQLNQIFDTIFMRDIIERYAIRDVHLLQDLLRYAVQNAGNLTNISKLTEHLKQKKMLPTTSTLYQYIAYLQEALLLQKLEVYDLQGKSYFERIAKRYPQDHGFISIARSGFDVGFGKSLETYVLNTAQLYGRKAYVGRYKDHEVDFIFEKGAEKIYVQVCYLLANEEVVSREYGSLLALPNNYRKYVVSLDPYQHASKEGIEHIQAWNWESFLQK